MEQTKKLPKRWNKRKRTTFSSQNNSLKQNLSQLVNQRYIWPFPPFFLIFLVQIIKTNTQENEDANNTENEEKETLGKLYFTAQYSYAQSALIVTINRCTNLPAKDSADNSRLRKMSQKLVDNQTFQWPVHQAAAVAWQTTQGEDQGDEKDIEPSLWWGLHILWSSR